MGGDVRVSARHSDASRRLRPAGWLVAVLAIAVLAPGALVASQFFSPSTANPVAVHTSSAPARPRTKPVSAPLPPFAVDHPAAANGAAPCTTVRIAASMENQDMVRALAEAYSAEPRSVGGHCVRLVVSSGISGEEETALNSGFSSVPTAQRPDIWLPDSSA